MERLEILEYFNGRFGTSIDSRMKKLEEELIELKEAASKDIYKSQENFEDFVDELSDLNGVLFHIAGILDLSQEDLMKKCIDKVMGREKDPNYKRKHPHNSDVSKMRVQIAVLKDLSRTYPTASIGNIIMQIEERIKNLEK